MILKTFMGIRNWMFDHGWLEERHFAGVRTVCIGNLAVGGTGKTPHTEWLTNRLIADGRQVAILSRGYGRRTRGFYEVTPQSTADEVGDEPLQMYARLGGRATVAVCEDRRLGIDTLLRLHPSTEVIVMDDAFQHRYVHPDVRILLTDFARPYYADKTMPFGRLREAPSGAARADAIVVTKCPPDLTAEAQNAIVARIKPRANQHVYFTTLHYEPLPELPKTTVQLATPPCSVAIIAGIAHPEPFCKHIASLGHKITAQLLFPDHHSFSPHDVSRINQAAHEADYIVTTAKDYARMRHLALSDEARRKTLVQHIQVHFLNAEDDHLYQLIQQHSLC